MDNDIKTDKEPEAPAAEAEEKKPGDGPENTEETEAGATEEIGKKERKHLKKKISELESKLEAAEAEAAKCKAAAAEKDDKYLRLLAEFDNYKKRTAKPSRDIRRRTKTRSKRFCRCSTISNAPRNTPRTNRAKTGLCS